MAACPLLSPTGAGTPVKVAGGTQIVFSDAFAP